jgi:hypothetical protein
MTLEEYLTPDPSLRAPVSEPIFIPDVPASRSSRKINLHSKGSVRGFDFFDGRQTWYEAELEIKFGLLAKARPGVTEVVEQPPAVQYVDDDGVVRRHTFDWLVVNGCRQLVAVKPAALVEKSGILRIRELVAAQISRSVADEIVLFTEEKLTAVDLFNAGLMHHVMKEAKTFPDDDAVVTKLAKRLRRPATIASLVERSKLDGWGFKAIVRAIVDGRLRLVEYDKIDYVTAVVGGRPKAD